MFHDLLLPPPLVSVCRLGIDIVLGGMQYISCALLQPGKHRRRRGGGHQIPRQKDALTKAMDSIPYKANSEQRNATMEGAQQKGGGNDKGKKELSVSVSVGQLLQGALRPPLHPVGY